MSSDPSSNVPEVQTFEMPKPPPPPPEEPEDKTPKKASASQWIILIFLVTLGGLIGFYTLYYAPKIAEERAAAEAAANYVRPWPERVEEAIRTTFEGQAGDDLVGSVQTVLAPEATSPKLQGLDLTPTEQNMVVVFRMSWQQAAEGAPEPSLVTAQVKWTTSEKKHLSAELIMGEGAPEASEEQDQEVKKLFANQVHPIVRRNTAEK